MTHPNCQPNNSDKDRAINRLDKNKAKINNSFSNVHNYKYLHFWDD